MLEYMFNNIRFQILSLKCGSCGGWVCGHTRDPSQSKLVGFEESPAECGASQTLPYDLGKTPNLDTRYLVCDIYVRIPTSSLMRYYAYPLVSQHRKGFPPRHIIALKSALLLFINPVGAYRFSGKYSGSSSIGYRRNLPEIVVGIFGQNTIQISQMSVPSKF